MINNYDIPCPNEWNNFEDMVCDIFSDLFKFNNFQRYGRNLRRYGRTGQTQNGVDIAGHLRDGIIGIQCKLRSGGTITFSEIKNEIKEADGFTPTLSEYYIATTAKRDAEVTSKILSISKDRVKRGNFPVHILFWEDLAAHILNSQDIYYKYYSDLLPNIELINKGLYVDHTDEKNTLLWPFSKSEIKGKITHLLNGLPLVDPYKLSVGISEFETTYSGVTDLEINLLKIQTEEESTDDFISLSRLFSDFKKEIDDQDFSKHVRLYLSTRLSTSILLGWKLRKVTGYSIEVVQKDNVIWATEDLPEVSTGLFEREPYIMDLSNDSIAVVLNISRDILNSVKDYIFINPDINIKGIWTFQLNNFDIRNPAQAYSIAREISVIIKNFVDWWGVKTIHLFFSMPSGLAALVGYYLNATCSLFLYHRNDDRDNYILSGVIDKKMEAPEL